MENKLPQRLDLPVEDLARLLESGTHDEQLDAAYSLSQVSQRDPVKGGKARDVLVRSLSNKDEWIRVFCAHALAYQSQEFDKVAKVYCDLSSSEDDWVRLQAILGLNEDQKLAAKGSDVILSALDDLRSEVRVAAMRSMRHLQPLKKDVVTKLVGFAVKETGSSGVRTAALESLVYAHADLHGYLLESVMLKLDRQPADVLEAYCQLLGIIGKKSKRAQNELKSLIDHTSLSVARQAIESLGATEYPVNEMLKVVREKLKSPSRVEKSACLRVLKSYGPRAKGLVGEVLPMLDDDEQVGFVLEFLAAVGKDAEASLPRLRSIESSTTDEVLRKQVRTTIKAIEGR